MKNQKRHIFYITLILLIVLSVIYTFPRKFNKDYSGVIYRIGDSSYSESIKISFDGYFSKGLLNGDKFQGEINIGDNKLTKINMKFNSFNRAEIDYYDESLGEYKIYGGIVSSNIKDRFTICVFEVDKHDSGLSTWSSKNGLMISAPANSRSEALDISKGVLEDKKLK